MKIPLINVTPAIFRDVEDLARLSKEQKGSFGEGLFSRAAIIMSVVALEHFAELYLDKVGDLTRRERLKREIAEKKRDKSIRTTLAAKWYVLADNYTPNRFLTRVPPFAELVEVVQLRNRLIHPTQKKLKSRVRGGTPQLLAKTGWKKAEWACRVMKSMIVAFYQMAYRQPPDWI